MGMDGIAHRDFRIVLTVFDTSTTMAHRRSLMAGLMYVKDLRHQIIADPCQRVYIVR